MKNDEKEKERRSFITLVEELFSFQRVQSLVKKQFLEEIVKQIDESHIVVGLLDIGSEGAIVEIESSCGDVRVLKIANPKFDRPGKQRWLVRGFLHVDREDNNVFRKRYILGTREQKALWDDLNTDRINKILVIPNVFRITEQPGLCIEMERIPGIPILRWLMQKKDIVYSSKMFLNLLKSIEFIHNRGIVHRDLKSDNILISDKDRIGIIDWTMSKKIGDRGLTVPGVSMGSSPNASPKMIINAMSGMANFTDDIFCLGVILWEFFNFQKAPRAKEPNLLLENTTALHEYLCDLENNLPNELLPLFRRCTDFDESARYQTIEPIIFEFDRAINKMGLNAQGSWEPGKGREKRTEANKMDKLTNDIQQLNKRVESIEKIFKLINKMVLERHIYE